MRWIRRPSQDALWKDEFSCESSDERYVNRRQFTKFLVLTSLGMFAGNLWILLRSLFYREPSYPSLTVARLEEIPIGGVKLFKYPSVQDPCLLVRLGMNEYVAYSQKCTHLSCAVYYSQQHNRLECPATKDISRSVMAAFFRGRLPGRCPG